MLSVGIWKCALFLHFCVDSYKSCGVLGNK